MRITRKITVALATAAVAAGGAAAVVDAAAASTATHTIRLTAVVLKSTSIKNSFVQAEKDMQRGKVTGYDAVSCAFNNATHKANCDGSFARADGMLYVHATVDQTGHGTGKVTGGTRAYKGATGTVALAPGSSQNQTKITIRWTH
jgi:hypothetical protein